MRARSARVVEQPANAYDYRAEPRARPFGCGAPSATAGADSVLRMPDDLPDPLAAPPQRRRTLRPRDAATLILVRRDRVEPEVLMGHRSARHVFMPNTFVFPGGRVDPEDARVPVATPLRPAVAERLHRNATPTRARALALAAIREAFEETGLLIGRPAADVDPERVPASWRPFFEQGIAPALDVLDYVFRAITPPGDVRRFHARFFIADARHVQGEIRGSGELLDLQWIPIEHAIAMPNTPGITSLVLQEVRRLLAHTDPMELPAAHRVPVYRSLYRREVVSYD